MNTVRGQKTLNSKITKTKNTFSQLVDFIPKAILARIKPSVVNSQIIKTMWAIADSTHFLKHQSWLAIIKRKNRQY